MIPSSWKRYQLSQLINKALSLPKPVPFDFLVRGEILRTSLGEWCTEKGVGEVRLCRKLDLSELSAHECRRKP
jgi:ribosome biogenesis protein